MTDIYTFIGEQKPFDEKDLNQMVYDLLDADTTFADINKYTIYIPSKGRATTNKSTMTLIGLNYKLVVEPQDYETYCKVYPKDVIIQMDKNDQGLAYVRNFIKEYSRGIGETKHWQIDDDIEGFKIRKHNINKNEKVSSLVCLSIAEMTSDMFSNVAITGINPDVFAFARTVSIQKNKLTCQCVLVDNNIDASWEYDGAEDWHYTLSVLERGYCTLAFHHLMTYSPAPGKNSGGCKDIHYADHILKPLLQNFVHRWPGKFLIKEEENSPKRWRLKPARKFFGDYKQQLIYKQ